MYQPFVAQNLAIHSAELSVWDFITQRRSITIDGTMVIDKNKTVLEIRDMKVHKVRKQTQRKQQ